MSTLVAPRSRAPAPEPTVAMGLGASAEQPAGGAEGFHLHGVSGPCRTGGLGMASPPMCGGRPITGLGAVEAGSRP